jgi:AraC-like DNA-binding protein
MPESTLAATIVADMLQYLETHGLPAEEMARACGITLRLPPETDARVPGHQVERLWAASVEATGDPLVGLHMAEAYSPGTLDIVGYVMLSCRTIGDVLDRFSRYVRVLNDGLRVSVVREGAITYCRPSFVTSADNYLLRRPAEAIDSLWGGFARELARLASTPLVAQEVWMRRADPGAAGRAEYQRVFGAPVRYAAAEDRFILPSTHLAEQVRSANPQLLAAFEQHADAVLAELDRPASRSHQVAQVLVQRLKGTVPPLKEVARELSMSDRNLQRALRNDGTSYQKLLDEVRRDLALRHLAAPGTSASQVGFLLGFSEPSAFHRAFRRWTGKAPGEYRATA